MIGYAERTLTLADEVRLHGSLELGELDARLLAGVDALHQPCHVATECAHGLHALFVASHLIGRVAVHLIPVGSAHHHHVGNGEILVHLIERRTRAAASARYHRSRRLTREQRASTVEQAVHERGHGSRCGRKVHRRAEHKRIVALRVIDNLVHHVVDEAMPVLETLAAAQAPRNSTRAQPHDVGLHALLLQARFHRAERRIGAAHLVRAAVDKQCLHSSPFVKRRERPMKPAAANCLSPP